MIISSRIQEEIGLNTDSWEFSDHPTVKHLKEFLSEGDGASQVKGEEEEEEEEEEAIQVVPFESDPSQLGSQSERYDLPHWPCERREWKFRL